MDKQVESSLKEIMNTARDNVIRRGKKSYQREWNRREKDTIRGISKIHGEYIANIFN